MPMIFKGHNEQEEPMDLVATHQRLLIASCMRTCGPILELGVGWYSTPLLHEIAQAQRRIVITIDNNYDWLALFSNNLKSEHHIFHKVGCWDELIPYLIDRKGLLPFSVVFVDQGQPCEREYAVKSLLPWANLFVMHDTEEGFAYGYDRLLGYTRYPGSQVPKHCQDSGAISPYGLFPYQYTDKSQKAWTTIASRKTDVGGWFKDLPPVQPTKEIT